MGCSVWLGRRRVRGGDKTEGLYTKRLWCVGGRVKRGWCAGVAGWGAGRGLGRKIRASVYTTAILVPSEPECGVLGCAMLAGFAAGFFSSLESARSDLVRYEGEILPNPAWSDRYQKLQSLFDDL